MSAPNGTGRGKKRPRRFHHGPAAGRKGAQDLAKIEAAEERGRTSADAMRAVGARYHEDIDLLDGLRHAAPFVPRIEAAL